MRELKADIKERKDLLPHFQEGDREYARGCASSRRISRRGRTCCRTSRKATGNMQEDARAQGGYQGEEGPAAALPGRRPGICKRMRELKADIKERKDLLPHFQEG